LNSTLISISGPTAVGKTLFAIELAKKFDTEIISFDSRQFYKEISIGTAVPSKDELAQVKHHFIQHKSIHDQYKVSDYIHDVDELIKTLSSKKKHIVLVGGSNLYLKSIIYGLDDIPEVPLEIRNKLNYEFQIHGVHRNPLTVQLPKVRVIDRKNIAEFKKTIAPILAELDLIKGKNVLSAKYTKTITKEIKLDDG